MMCLRAYQKTSRVRLPRHLESKVSRGRRWKVSDAVERRLQELIRRYNEIMEELNKNPGSASLGKELSSLSVVSQLVQDRESQAAELESIQELLRDALEAKDGELEEECHNELQRLEEEERTLDRKLVDAVVPEDDDDYESDAIVEIRSGTGGDEASLFAAELLEAYRRTAKALKWNVETLNESRTEIGGVREAALSVSGRPTFRVSGDEEAGRLLGPYGAFKFESGGHRVQRVPVNDSRIHTSACSVAVLPSLTSKDTIISPSDLKIETMRASGSGGQHVNTTDSAVRITHIPTGITASIQDERTQHQNKTKALKLISARVRDRQREEEEVSRGATRSALMGGGDRSERIRTYNFPNDRVTDHRAKVSKHGIEGLFRGGTDDGLVASFLPELKNLRREELLSQLEDNAIAS